MWIPNITDKSTDANGILNVTVTFTDDTGKQQPRVQNFHGVTDKNNLDNLIAQTKSTYEAMDTANSAISTGTWTPPTPVTPAPPSQAQIDQQNFQRYLGLVQLLAAAKSMGWITGNEQMVVDIKTKVMALATANLPKLFL